MNNKERETLLSSFADCVDSYNFSAMNCRCDPTALNKNVLNSNRSFLFGYITAIHDVGIKLNVYWGEAENFVIKYEIDHESFVPDKYIPMLGGREEYEEN